MSKNSWNTRVGTVLVIVLLLISLPTSLFTVWGQSEPLNKDASELLAPTADEAYLVKDINPARTSGSLSPEELVDVNGIVYFTADDWQHGQELWKSDGTEAGTVMVKDIYPEGDSSDPDWLINFNGTLFFEADDGVHGRQLWKSDGTADGTVMVTDVDEVDLSYDRMVVSNGTLYFVADDGIHGYALWKTDGTASGTVMVKDILLDGLTDVAGTLFLIVQDDQYDIELWKSDGTESGTVRVKDINLLGSSWPSYLTAAGSMLYFSADDGMHGRELWKSDGTDAGTIMVKDIHPSGSSYPGWLIMVGDQIFFTANDGITGVELWVSDGTDAGTRLVKDISVSGSSSPTDLIEFNGLLYFTANDGVHGSELWVSDGTEAGTFMVVDLLPGSDCGEFGTEICSSRPDEKTQLEDVFFFTIQNDQDEESLWKSDGTASGTEAVKLFSSVGQLTAVNDLLFFSASELWKSDGTEAGTQMVFDLTPGRSSSIQLGVVLNHQYFFQADDDVHGRELWVSDASAAGTVLFLDLYPDMDCGEYSDEPCSSSPENFIVVDDLIFFTAEDGIHGRELWKSDGTIAGTSLVKDINPAVAWYPLGNLTAYQNQLFFSADDGLHGSELWKSDGSEAGTVMVKDIDAEGDSNPGSFTIFHDWLYFSAKGGLWRTDGTMEGTILVTEEGTGMYLTATEQLLFFVGYDDMHGYELWRSDGTAAGTYMVKEIIPEMNQFTYPFQLYGLDDLVYFIVDDGLHGYELWVSDGSESGTNLVRDIHPDGSAFNFFVSVYTSGRWFVDYYGKLYFRANDGLHGWELWQSDGTEAGTTLVRDINLAGNANPIELFVAAGGLYFSANDGESGRELWRTDGTAAGTVLVQDIANDLYTSSNPGLMIYNGSCLLFRATDYEHGAELWAMPLTDQPTAITSVNLSGPAQGEVDTAYEFTASIGPDHVELPVTYVWQATSQETITHTVGLSDAVMFIWEEEGIQVITLTVSSAVNSLSDSLEIWIEDPIKELYLPVMQVSD